MEKQRREFWRNVGPEIGTKYSCGILCTTFVGQLELMTTDEFCGSRLLHSQQPYPCSANHISMETCKAVINEKICDGICNGVISEWPLDCLEERNCNGYTYGFFCSRTQHSFFGYGERSFTNGFDFICTDGHTTIEICATSTIGDELCAKALQAETESDIVHCKPYHGLTNLSHPDMKNVYRHYMTNLRPDSLIQLFNFSKCGPLGIKIDLEMTYFKICEGYREQANCTDPAKIGLFCKIDGFTSSVAKQIVCNGELEKQLSLFATTV